MPFVVFISIVTVSGAVMACVRVTLSPAAVFCGMENSFLLRYTRGRVERQPGQIRVYGMVLGREDFTQRRKDVYPIGELRRER